VLGNLPLIKSSRTTLSVNTLRRKDFSMRTVITDVEELAAMDHDASALTNSPASQLGRRDAYHALCCQQIAEYGSMAVTFFAFLSAYTTTKAPRTASAVHEPHEDNANTARPPPHLKVDEHGFVMNLKRFVLGEVRK
jgi:hypothetical protein